jgi:dipeptidyl aminopeptidase/acylaminoacyl peptidase
MVVSDAVWPFSSSRRRLLGTLLGSAALPAVFLADAVLASRRRAETAEHFVSGGRKIPLYAYRIGGAGANPPAAPAVVILYGSDALGGAPGKRRTYQSLAGALNARGLSVFLPDYLAGLETGKSAPRFFARRQRILADALAQVRGFADVDAARLGLAGFSLGGFHALALAADQDIAAVASVGGALPRDLEAKPPARLPPTLLIHGGRDRTVAPERALQLAALLAKLGVSYELEMFPGEGHAFSAGAMARAEGLIADFFSRTLGPATP